MIVIIKIYISGILTMLVVGLLKFIQRKNMDRYKKNKVMFDIICGILLGLCAVYATELGSVAYNGAGINVRDIAPASAGLFFSPLSGFIAGLIGGIERYFCVYWGGGAYTRYACTIACILTGLISGFLSKYMFKSKRPKILQAMYVALTCEVIHMLLVFITNLNDMQMAFDVVSRCSKVMILGNTVAIMFVAFMVKFIEQRYKTKDEKELDEIKKKLKARDGLNIQFQKYVLILVTICYFITTFGSYKLATEIGYENGKNLIVGGLGDVEAWFNKNEIDDEVIKDLFYTWHIGNEGGYVAFKDTGTCLFGHEYVGSTLGTLRLIPEGTKQNEFFNQIIHEANCLCSFRIMGEYIILAFVPEEEILYDASITGLLTKYMEILVYAFLFVQLYFLVRESMISQIDKVNDGLTEITRGNLDTKIKVNSSKEFEYLSNRINQTVSSLKQLQKEAEVRMEKDLALAKLIQSSACPKGYPAFPQRNDIDLFASMDPAKEVGGDFYDYYFVDDNKIALLVADVSGKGIPAAMFMMRGKSIIKALAERGLKANEVLKEANHSLCEGNDAEMFITAWLAIVDINEHKLSYASAGHNPPLFKKKGGNYEYLSSRPGLVLAALDNAQYNLYEIPFNEGDKIFLYTDGVTEANNKEEKLYGEMRLNSVANSIKTFDSKSLCEFIKLDVDKFADGKDQFDDITMLAFSLKDPDYKENIEKYYGDNSITVIATVKNQQIITSFIERNFEDLDVDDKVVKDINVAIDEIYSNVANYAYGTHAGLCTVVVRVLQDPSRIAITFIDSGMPYNPLELNDPNTTLSAEEREIGGLGVFMVKKMMDNVHYEFKDGMNCLTIEKNIIR